MSFLEGVHQYQANTASNTQTLNSVKETASVRPASQLQELVPGKVFEGMVTDIKSNGQVTLGLSDGSTIQARMETGVTLEQGQPMLFEVKGTTEEQISIRPVVLESAQNPTLMKALEAAGLKVNPRNLSMVNQMMMEQLPIDRNSLLQMARAAAGFPQADMQTLVQMQKLGFQITENSLNQFQNYQNGQQAILPDLQNLMEGLANLPEQLFGQEGQGLTENFTLGGSGQNPATAGAGQNPAAAGVGQNPAAGAGQQTGRIPGIQQQIMEILLGNSTQAEGAGAAGGQTETVNPDLQNPVSQNPASQGTGVLESLTGAAQAESQAQVQAKAESQVQVQAQAGVPPEAPESAGKESGAQAQNSINQILTGEQQENLASMLKESGAAENQQLLPQGRLNANLSAGEFLQQMMKALESSEYGEAGAMKKLFSSKEVKNLMKQAMTEQWMLTPEKLKEEGAVKELYQRLNRQMSELQQVLSQAGKEGSALAKTAQSVQNNLDFMNQLNQVYTYVQLPLKLQQQNAHSDLYVYTNKKNLREKEGDLSALLHLDMEHLGSTDIYVKMHGQSVQTDFYLADEKSYRLIAGFTDKLAERLEQKGYSCEIKVENRKLQKDSPREFLEQEKPAGKLHRYSFDVKA